MIYKEIKIDQCVHINGLTFHRFGDSTIWNRIVCELDNRASDGKTLRDGHAHPCRSDGWKRSKDGEGEFHGYFIILYEGGLEVRGYPWLRNLETASDWIAASA